MFNREMTSARKPSRRTAVKDPKRHQKAKQERVRLEDFGYCLHTQRLKVAQLSQAAMAQELQALGHDNPTQSFVAQLETGRITNPSSELLDKVYRAYKFPSYDSVFSVFAADKYKLSQAKADLIRRDIRDLEGLAQWEIDIRPDELWIVAPNFVDEENSAIFDAVLKNLQRPHCTLTYFIDESDIPPEKRFGKLLVTFYRMRKQTEPPLLGKVRWFGLTPIEIRIMASSFVIANPKSLYAPDSKAEGYTVIPYRGRPQWGIRMESDDLKTRIAALNVCIAQKENEAELKGEDRLRGLLPSLAINKRELDLSHDDGGGLK